MNAKKIPIKKDEVPVFLKKVSRGGRTTWWMPPLENFLMHHFLSFSREHVSTSDAVVHITPRPSSNSIEVDCRYSHPCIMGGGGEGWDDEGMGVPDIVDDLSSALAIISLNFFYTKLLTRCLLHFVTRLYPRRHST